MIDESTSPTNPGGTIATTTVVLMAGAGFALLLGWLVGPTGVAGTVYVILRELPVAAGIFLASAGWGGLVVRGIAPKDTPAGLRAVTSAGVGLWLAGSAMLAVGSLVPGGLSPTPWWAVLIGGLVLAVWQVRHVLARTRLPGQLDGLSVLLVLAVLAGAVWLAGATWPPELVGKATGDFYDVVSYHLQVPRQYHDAGAIIELPHNTYSYYPFGAEMLGLWAMILRGGPHVGAYAAKLTHGLWGVLAVLTVAAGLPGRSLWRRRMAPALLATCPGLMYVSFLAFVELAQLAYLALAVAWLGYWLRRPSARSAGLIGAACGAACAVKYLSVGLVAGPVLAVLLVAAIAKRRPIDWPIAAAACGLLFAPWLIRNAIWVGNPVFPLATDLLGRGHWSAASAAMWDAAHAPPAVADRPGLFARAVFDIRGLGALLWLVTLAGAGWAITRPRRRPYDAALATIWLLQVGVWATCTHMATRFLLPAAAGMALLCGGFLHWLGRRGKARTGDRPAAPWGASLALTVVFVTAGFDLVVARQAYLAELDAGRRMGIQLNAFHGLTPAELREAMGIDELLDQIDREGGTVLMVADNRPFNLPDNVLAYSIWEQTPLLAVLEQTEDPAEIARRLRGQYGITHLWINWSEVERLRRTYGWWEQIDETLVDSLLAAGGRRLPGPGQSDTQPSDTAPARPMVELIELPDASR